MSLFPAFDCFVLIFPAKSLQNSIIEQADKKHTYLFNNIKGEKNAGSSILLFSCSKGSKYQLTCWLKKSLISLHLLTFWNSSSYLPNVFLIMNKEVPICLAFDLFSQTFLCIQLLSS